MSMRSSSCRICCLVVVLGVFIGPACFSAPWTTKLAQSEHFTLNYPSFMTERSAADFLVERESALAFAEASLEGELFYRSIATIVPTLMVQATDVDTSPDGRSTLTYYVPVPELLGYESESVSSKPVAGCAGEVKAVANRLWSAGAEIPLVLSEGLAMLIDERYRSSTRYQDIARALLRADGLLHVDDLLASRFPPGSPSFNIAHGGASFVEFLIEEYGIERFGSLYGAQWMYTSRTAPHTVHYADPAVLVQSIYGLTEEQLDDRWRDFIWDPSKPYLITFDPLREALTPGDPRLPELVGELETYWDDSPYRLVGPSEAASEALQELTHDGLELPTQRGSDLTMALNSYQRLQQQLIRLLSDWLDTIHVYEEALALGENGDPEELIPLLEAAEAGYAAAGDGFMAAQAAGWLAALRAT